MIAVAALLVATGGAVLLWYCLVVPDRSDRLRGRLEKVLGAWRRGPRVESMEEGNRNRSGPLRAFLRQLLGENPQSHWGTAPSLAVLTTTALLTSSAAVWLAESAFQLHPAYLALLAIAAFLWAPRALIRIGRRRNEQRLLEVFPDAVDMVARALRAGVPITGAIRSVAREIERPVSTLFQKITDQVAIGIALDEALERVSAQLALPEFRFFSVAVTLQRTTGGNLADTLETMGEILRRRKAMRLKARAASAEMRISGLILAAMPIVMGLGLYFAAPAYIAPLITDPRGHLLLGIAALCLAAGGLTMRSIMRRNLQI